MNMRSILLLLFLALLSQSAVAQGFLRTYAPELSEAADLVQTADGGYVMAGIIHGDSLQGGVGPNRIFLQRVDADGNIVWTNHLDVLDVGANSVCQTVDGGFALVSNLVQNGNNDFSRVFKVDAAGQVVWTRDLATFNDFNTNGFSDIVSTSDGGMVIAGNDYSGGADVNFRLVKLDANGNVLWDNALGTVGTNERAEQLLELPGGDLIVAGNATANADPDLTLLRVSASGTLVWQQWYPHAGLQNCTGVALSSDGILGVTADDFSWTLSESYQFLTTDLNGQQLGYYDIIPPVSSGVSKTSVAICADADGNFVLTGIVNGLGVNTYGVLIVQKLDVNAQQIWLKEFEEQSYPENIIYTADGGFAISGYKFDSNGFYAMLVKLDGNGDVYTNTINGLVYFDDNNNCTRQAGEPALAEFIVAAEKAGGETIFATVQPDGTWTMLVGTGDFTFTLLPRYGASDVWQGCNMAPLNITTTFQTINLPETGARSLVDCPYLDVDLGSFIFRPCLETYFNVSYCNNGNQTATGTYVELNMDPAFTYVSSEIPLTSQTGNTYRFDLGNLAPGECNVFRVDFQISCNVELGQTLCTEAHIFPDTLCTPPDPLWDGSHLSVVGVCNGNDVEFTVKNNGLGNMTQLTDFVIIEDQIIYMEGKIQLDAGQDSVFTVSNLGGNTYYMSVDQTPLHPGNSQPSAGVDFCGGNPIFPGILLQLSQDENDPFLAIDCDIVRVALDPNDKQGYPLGWLDENFIERGQELDYKIRFQNTGNDTAFLVVIRDTIDMATLDAASIRPGASSHPYTWSLSGNGVLKFTFENIELPDSNTNLDASQGYVQFRIRQQPDLIAGTKINNRVGIYFDFNAPVITNTTLHTIADDLVSVSTDAPNAVAGVDLQVFPNPFVDQAQFVLEGIDGSVQPRISVYNTAGQLVRQEQHNQSTFTFRRSGLETGMYFYRVDDQFGRMLAGGRIVVGGN